MFLLRQQFCESPSLLYFTISIEVQIVLAICLFYLYDAALLLEANEGLLRRSASRWYMLLASNGFELRQRYLLWPSIFVLHQPVYRGAWSSTRIELGTNKVAKQDQQDLLTHSASFKGFALPLYLLAASLFAGLPVAMFVLHSEVAQLIALACIYLCTFWVSFMTLRHGKRGHTPQALARSTALQMLLCPPFALNAVRKLSLAHRPAGDLLSVAYQLMDSEPWSELNLRIQTQMEREMQEIADLPEYTQQLAQMQAALQTLKANSPE